MAGRFQETKGRWEIVSSPTTTADKVILPDDTNVKEVLDALSTEYSEGITLNTSGVQYQNPAIITIDESDNCSLESVVVTMGGSNITSSVWNSDTNTITIANVTDDVTLKISTTALSTLLVSVIINNIDETNDCVGYDDVNDVWIVTFTT
jgi:hypothetical protein